MKKPDPDPEARGKTRFACWCLTCDVCWPGFYTKDPHEHNVQLLECIKCGEHHAIRLTLEQGDRICRGGAVEEIKGPHGPVQFVRPTKKETFTMFTKVAGISFREKEYLFQAMLHWQAAGWRPEQLLNIDGQKKAQEKQLDLSHGLTMENLGVLYDKVWNAYRYVAPVPLQQFEEQRLLFPWWKLKEHDICEIIDDPYGRVTGNDHPDPNALAVVQQRDKVWLGFIPNNADRESLTADLIRQKQADGFFVSSCRISALTGGNGKNRGINLELEFAPAMIGAGG